MKKILLSLSCGILMCSLVMPVMAQELTQKRKTAVFSPAVVAGRATQAQKGQQVKKSLPKTARTTILRFEPGQIELSDVQKELLLHVVERLNGVHSARITLVTASKDDKNALSRASHVRNFLEIYTGTSVAYYVRTISPKYIVPSINNTVKITINR